MQTNLPHEFWGQPPVDVGNGVVARDVSANLIHDSWESSSYRIELVDCRSRDRVTVSADVFNYDLTTDSPPSEAELQTRASFDAFRQLVESRPETTMSGLLSQAEDLGFSVRAESEGAEYCGCAALYPELLGDQIPAKERSA
ncbi:MAG: hypothetical protein AAFU41_15955 [Pseudomonadota bacterium]